MAEWAYDFSETEPAPVVHGILFSRWGLGVRIPVEFCVDTGASMTVVPSAALASLGVRPVRTAILQYPDGRFDEVAVYEVDLEIIGFEIVSLEVSEGRMERALLGRDVLNYFFLTLDGPNGITRLEYRG